jgi:Tol biopolymer transport system component
MTKKPVVTQRSAQFEPYFHAPRTLYYSNVHCTIGCGKIIQEIWRKDLISGEAEQITLLNAIARQPVISGQWLYFSSNKAGNFHIWRMSLETGRYERLTEGRVTDINPALDRQSNLYFIRHTPTGTALMQRRTDGTLQTLPKTLENFRDLEISQ